MRLLEVFLNLEVLPNLVLRGMFLGSAIMELF